MITLPEIKIDKRETPETKATIDSIGLVFPFQPSMLEMKTVNSILNYTLEVVQMKLENRYEPGEIKKTIARLQKIFSRLNYNSHRKSVAIILNAEDEKIIYLNYSGKAVFFFNESFSLLDLVGDSEENPAFEILLLSKNKAELYEYINDSLHKVFAQTEEFCKNAQSVPECLVQRISNIIKLLNKRNDKPIFISCEDEQQTNKFCEFFPYREIVFKVSMTGEGDLQSKVDLLSKNIIDNWNHWQSKLVQGQIAIAKRTDSLFTHLNSVMTALKYSNDGLLLIDNFMKDEIHKSLEDVKQSEATQRLTDQIEKFLARGNRIEITEGGLLETLGGIAFIKETEPKFHYDRAVRVYKEEDFMI